MMKKTSVPGRGGSRRWMALLGTCAMLVLAGCAGTRSTAEQEAYPEGEQVDVGYGTIDRDHLVGSVSTIDGAQAQEAQPRSLADMLRGRAAGVHVTEAPGGGISVRIRGTRSLMASNEPLYVLDGMVMHTNGGLLYGINPLDIASISVLKDASATAVYGSRGANGVILIKTKRGGR